jgi:hypothetical protein
LPSIGNSNERRVVSAVQLTIVQPPAQETVFRGAAAGDVTLAGGISGSLPDELHGVALFYRWYSSLFPGQKDRYSLNAAGLTDPAEPFVTALKVGTHVITFAASDQNAETEQAQNETRHGGVTGGTDGSARRIIHVLIANLVKPAPAGPIPTLSKADSTLEAEAPLHWGRKAAGTDVYEPNSDYHTVNRIQYRWRFTPLGAPSGRRAAELSPALPQLIFDPDPPSGPKPLVRYRGRLPDDLDTGNYTLTLRVAHINDDTLGHEQSRAVIIKN